MANPTYRQWLQSLASGGSGLPAQEASALLNVVGDDFGVDKNFLADPYKYTGSDRGQVFSSLAATGSGDNTGYGPQGIQSINDIYSQKYQAKYGNGAGVTGTGGTGKTVNSAAVGATQSAIDSLGTESAVGNKNIDDSYKSVIGKYDNENVQNEGDYNENVVTNNTNLDKNTQNAYVSAAQGRRGLRGTLAAIGALGGDGSVLADRAVTEEANRDVGGARDTATTNDAALTKAITKYRDDDKERRAEADTSRANSKTALEGSIASKKQTFLQKMADLYSAGGDDASASNYLTQAGGLNNEIASKTAVAATPITARSAAFTPGTLENYLAGANDMTVRVADGGLGADGLPTILAGGDPNATKKKKDREDAVAAAAA